MSDNYLVYHGVLGQKWSVRRYQNFDDILTDKGKFYVDSIINLE